MYTWHKRILAKSCFPIAESCYAIVGQLEVSYLVSLDAIWSCLVSFSEEDEALLGQLVGVLSAHIGDDSPSVRRLCVKGLAQVTC